MDVDDEETAELKKRPLGPDGKPMSRKMMRQMCRMPLAMLKNLTKRPEVVEVCETSTNPTLPESRLTNERSPQTPHLRTHFYW